MNLVADAAGRDFGRLGGRLRTVESQRELGHGNAGKSRRQRHRVQNENLTS